MNYWQNLIYLRSQTNFFLEIVFFISTFPLLVFTHRRLSIFYARETFRSELLPSNARACGCLRLCVSLFASTCVWMHACMHACNHGCMDARACPLVRNVSQTAICFESLRTSNKNSVFIGDDVLLYELTHLRKHTHTHTHTHTCLLMSTDSQRLTTTTITATISTLMFLCR